MAYLDGVNVRTYHCTPSYSKPNQHPPAACPTSTLGLLQHTQPAPSYSTPNQHPRPPTAHPTSTLSLLQHTQPAPSYSARAAFATLYVPTLCTCHVSTHTTYVRMCLCSSATCDYCIQTVLHTSYTVLFGTHTYLQYRQYTGRHTVRKFMQNHTTPTKRRDRSSYSTHLGRQAATQHT